jgi:hypothetical protein
MAEKPTDRRWFVRKLLEGEPVQTIRSTAKPTGLRGSSGKEGWAADALRRPDKIHRLNPRTVEYVIQLRQ